MDDGLVTVIDTLLALVPEKHRPWVEALMALLWTLGLVLAAVKPLVARWVTSPHARSWFDALLRFLDLLAANTKGMDLRPMAEPKAKKARK